MQVVRDQSTYHDKANGRLDGEEGLLKDRLKEVREDTGYTAAILPYSNMQYAALALGNDGFPGCTAAQRRPRFGLSPLLGNLPWECCATRDRGWGCTGSAVSTNANY